RGSVWLKLLVFAAIYLFGIKSGVGAETLSQFFKMIRIDTHVGVSPSALRTQMNKMEELLPKFQDECEQNIDKQTRKVVAGLDETFFGDFLILVLMDLNSGYLLLETITEDRCYETWYEKTKPRLEGLGIVVNHAISDRAKALIKMAVTGFECESGADVFHAQQDVSRWLGARIGKRAAKAQKQLEEVQAKESKIKDSTKKSRVTTLKEKRVASEIELKEAQEIQAEYHENLQGIADEIHPFSLTDSHINDAEKVRARLELRAQAFENIAKKQAVLDKRKVMTKFRNQFKPLAVSVDFWWLWVRETLQNLAVENALLEEWLTEMLLPVVYWHHKMQQTKHRCAKEKYHQAWEQASKVIKEHPFSATLSESEIAHWLAWATNMAQQFQRSSSAVE
ncbi:MAG: aminoacyltransferase, partial [Candidatus Brocadiaceae bacterium]|nr:aminoacyltransferase [Candidatus Brocadiaceae bacterium]